MIINCNISTGSSDDTDGTFRSRSSAYVRFGGEDSIDSGRSNNLSEASKSKNKYESEYTMHKDLKSNKIIFVKYRISAHICQ